MEMVLEAKLLIVHMVCDKCGKGKMIPTEIALMSFPPQYPHKCDNCGHTDNFSISYPYQKLVPIEALRAPKEDEA